MPAPTPPAASGLLTPTPAQQDVLDRIAAQRARLRAERAEEAAQAAAQAQEEPAGPLGQAARAVRFLRSHPVLLAAIVSGGMALGPARIVRWVRILLPALLRLRRR